MTKYDMELPGMKLLVANLVWDLVPHADAPDILRQMDLNPPSPEGRQMECRTSHVRLSAIDPIEADLDFLAVKIAEIAVRVMLGSAAESLDESILAGIRAQYAEVIGAALKVTVANLMAAGLLTYNKRTRR